jgi:SAM-dependent methyltransferase
MVEPQAFKDNERLAWDLCAEKYDACLTEPFRPFADRLLSLVPLEQGQRVLDIATGSGLLAFMAAPLVGSRGEVIGVDLSPSMVQRADTRAQENEVQNVRFLEMDAEILDFPDQSFDAVVCALGLMLFPQPEQALLEMHRVLKPEGTVGLSVFGRGSKVALRALMEPFIPLMPPPGERGPSIFGFGKGQALHESLEQAGFSLIMVDEQAHVMTFQREEQVWEMLLSLGRLGQMRSRLGENQRARLRDDVLTIARENYLGPQGVFELPFQIIYATGAR